MHIATVTSAPSPTFPFGIEGLQLFDDDDDVHSLLSAAESGDIAVLDRVEQRFGGAFYDSDTACNAIESEHFAFYERYLLLCRWHLISIIENEEDDLMILWGYYLDPVHDCIRARADVEVRCKAARIIVEKFLPGLPEYDEIVFCKNTLLRYGAELRLPDYTDTIWALDNCHSIVNDDHGERIMASFRVIFHEKLFRYFTEEVGLKFDCKMLEYWSKRFSRRIYQFVLDHLNPNIDKSSLPAHCLFREESPNDGDFFNFVRFYGSCSKQSYLEKVSYMYMAEFLHDHPQFIPKIPSLMRELQNVEPSDNPLGIPTPTARWRAFSYPESIPRLLGFLQNVQHQIYMPDHLVQFDIYCTPRSRSAFTM